MGIKSDAWIRRMAKKERIIDPFSPTQVRRAEGGRSIYHPKDLEGGYIKYIIISRYEDLLVDALSKAS